MDSNSSYTFTTLDYLRELKRLYRTRHLFDAIRESRKGSFGDVQTFCLFIGTGRNGSSLQGSLLDAHPEIAIAMEQHTVDYIRVGLPRFYIFCSLLRNSQLSLIKQRRTGGYVYDVPGQWRGRFARLRVIGDKDAGHAQRLLTGDPSLLTRLHNMLGSHIALKVIHVVRNPYDVTSTIYRKSSRVDQTLHARVEGVLSALQRTNDLLARLPADSVYTSRHEDFVTDPKGKLADLCAFLGVEAPVDYLEACAAQVHESAHKSRYQVDWSDDLRNLMQQKLKELKGLEGYTFEN